MKILILGTSNSILVGGWVAGLRAEFPKAKIRNASVGASPGIQFATWLNEPLDTYDFVIFDSVVNDENLIEGIGSRTYQDRLMFEILSTIAAKTRLVVLGFSNRRFRDKTSEEYRMRKIISENIGAQFVGFRDLAFAHRDDLVKLNGSLFRDGAHIAAEIANMLGRALAAALKQRVAWEDRKPQDFSEEYHSIPADEFGSTFPLIALSNSLMTANFRALALGDRLSFDSDSALLGFYINCHRTDCVLRLTKTDGRTFDMLIAYDRSKGLMRRQFIPLSNGPQIAECEVIVTSNFDCRAQLTLESIGLPEDPIIQFGDFLYRKPFSDESDPLTDEPILLETSLLETLTNIRFRQLIDAAFKSENQEIKTKPRGRVPSRRQLKPQGNHGEP